MKHGSTLLTTTLWLCLSVFIFPFSSIASTWSALYGGTGHDEAASFKATGDGGCIIAGNTASFGAQNQVWVLKINASGSVEWQKVYSNTDKESYIVRSVDLIPGGGFILAGDALTCYEEDGPNCQGYGWLAKLTADGEVVWQKGYKDTEGYGSSFSAVQTTGDNGFVAVGRGATLGTVTARSKLWVVRVNAGGTIQGQRLYFHNDITDSYANSLQQTLDGGYIVAGALFSGITDWSDGIDVWVLKLSANLDVQWHAMVRGAYGYNDIGWSVSQTADGGYVIGGQTEDNRGYGADGLVMKLDAQGTLEWQKNYETGEGDNIKGLYQTGDGGYLIGGLYQGGGVAAKLNQTGEIVWQKKYQGNSIISMAPASDGMIMASGASATRDGISSNDFQILKTDESGSISTCLSVTDADVQVYDASLTHNTFPVTESSPDLRIINTVSIPSVTSITPLQECPYKMLALALSTARVTVASSPEGLQCADETCSGQFAGSSIVELTVYPETGATLVTWGGDCAECGSNESCSIAMDADKTCTAVFTALKGDINGDGTAGLFDAIMALQVIAGMDPLIGIGFGLTGADVNGNGIIDQAEAIYALQKTALLRPPSAFAAP